MLHLIQAGSSVPKQTAEEEEEEEEEGAGVGGVFSPERINPVQSLNSNDKMPP